MEEERRNLHVLMLPWLAMGHLHPFLELSKRLAFKKIKISFFSTPSNILRLPPIPQTLTPFLTFIPCSLPSLNNLPSNLDNTVDLRSPADRFHLHQAYADFEQHLVDFLSSPSQPKPNWIIYDFAAIWAPSVASRFNINSAFFSVFSATTVSFFSQSIGCETAEELTKPQARLPFATAVALRLFEARKLHPVLPKKRDLGALDDSKLLLIRTCREFEGKWLDSLLDSYTPVRLLPPFLDKEEEEEEAEKWGGIREWLDEREDGSVVYVAFGSEAKFSEEEIGEIGLGLEESGLPFVWVLRGDLPAPPRDFAKRVEGRGIVWVGWVPQPRLLAHPAIGGMLTHGGWGAFVEGMVVGAAMVALPMVYDQGLNVRNMVESGYAVEVERNDEDGAFSGEDIGRKLRLVMVDEEGEEVRKKAREAKEIFVSEKLQEEYVDEIVKSCGRRWRRLNQFDLVYGLCF